MENIHCNVQYFIHVLPHIVASVQKMRCSMILIGNIPEIHFAATPRIAP